jgi:hypothetical protein
MPTTTIPQTGFRTIDGVRIWYADSGSSQKPTVVLTRPWPESVYAFAPMWVKTCCGRGRWASSWPSSLPTSTSSAR